MMATLSSVASVLEGVIVKFRSSFCGVLRAKSLDPYLDRTVAASSMSFPPWGVLLEPWIRYWSLVVSVGLLGRLVAAVEVI